MRILLTGFIFLCSFAVLAQEKATKVGSQVTGQVDSLSMILSLLMVLAVIVASAYVLKRFNLVQMNTKGLKVVASLPLGNKEKLVVVQVGEQQLLLGVTSQQINVLSTLDQPLELTTLSGEQNSANVLNFLKKQIIIKK